MKMGWVSLAVLAMVSLSVMFLLYRKLGELGVRSEVVLMYYFGISAAMLLIQLLKTNVPLEVSQYQLGLLIASAIAGVAGNIFILDSMNIAPNPGYTLAIVGLNTVLVAIASIFIFGSELTLLKGAGVILAVAGAVLLGL